MQPITAMNKTLMNMYSTMMPTGPSFKRGQASGISRSSRYRYANANKSFNPQIANISSSITKQYKTQTRVALPGIKRQKGFMLQQWLNDALQGDEGMGIKQPLKTLKKYQMDKGSLKNANLSIDQISNLYNGLFVYTSGIKNTFQEMFKSASLQNRDDHKIQKTYWKIFIKLLENTIPVKNCFQIIQDQYRREITNLKRTIVQDNQKLLQMQEEYQEKLKKQRKEKQQMQKKQKDFEKQYKVMNSNLILYEQSFNQEVYMRLKFEQKINQVYTSYDELKQKFECVRLDLGYKSKLLMQTLQQKRKLQNQVLDQQIKNGDIIQRLQMAQSKLAQRQSQIVIKNQQITDIKQQNHSTDEKKKLQQIALDQLIVTIKMLKKNQMEHDKKISQLKGIITANEETIKRLKQSLLDARQKNDDLYLKCHESIIKNQQYEDTKMKLSIQLQETKTKLLLIQNKLSITQFQKQQVTNKFHNLENQMIVKTKEISDKNMMIQAFNSNISELKAIKDRYQRQNQILKMELTSNQVQLNNKIKQLGQQKSKTFEHKYQMQKLLKMNNDLQITITKLNKTIEKLQLQSIVAKDSFKSQLNEANLKAKEVQLSLNQQKKELSKVNETLCKKDNEKLNKLQEMAYLKKRNNFLQKELQDKKDKIKQLLEEKENILIQIDQLKKKVQSKDFIINHKREEIDGQIINLRLANLRYKKIIQDRQQYVNPMIYQDQRSRIIQLIDQIEQLKAKDSFQTDQ